MNDPSEGVRNNAMRALAVIAPCCRPHARPDAAHPGPTLVGFSLPSIRSDRNKASSHSRTLPRVGSRMFLATLQIEQSVPLVEMALDGRLKATRCQRW